MPLIFTVYAGLHHVKSAPIPLTEHTAFQSIRVGDSPKISSRDFFWEVFCTICQVSGMFCSFPALRQSSDRMLGLREPTWPLCFQLLIQKMLLLTFSYQLTPIHVHCCRPGRGTHLCQKAFPGAFPCMAAAAWLCHLGHVCWAAPKISLGGDSVSYPSLLSHYPGI